MFTVGIITASDKGFRGERDDKSGQVIKDMIKEAGYTLKKYILLPDEKDIIEKELIYMCDDLKVNLVLTTGGTGFSQRDITPEATKAIIEREANGISEAIRYYSLQITPRAMLSRGVSGIRKNTLIINLPGSEKAVRESLEFILPSIKHGIEVLTGEASECGR